MWWNVTECEMIEMRWTPKAWPQGNKLEDQPSPSLVNKCQRHIHRCLSANDFRSQRSQFGHLSLATYVQWWANSKCGTPCQTLLPIWMILNVNVSPGVGMPSFERAAQQPTQHERFPKAMATPKTVIYIKTDITDIYRFSKVAGILSTQPILIPTLFFCRDTSRVDKSWTAKPSSGSILRSDMLGSCLFWKVPAESRDGNGSRWNNNVDTSIINNPH